MKALHIALAVMAFSPITAQASEMDLYDYFKSLRRGDSLSTAESNNWLVDRTSTPNLISIGSTMAAKSLGVESGQLYAENEIRKILEASSTYLDEIYDLSPYLMTYKSFLVMPAIVTEVDGRKTYLNESKTAFTYANKTYFIQSQPYFIDSPPSWRNYVRYSAKPPEILTQKLLPKTAEEIENWERSFDEGWKVGIKTAVDSVKYQLARGLYDLQGVQTYIMARDAGIVSDPIYKGSNFPVSGTKNKLELDGGAISIEVQPRMIHDASEWRIIPQLPPLDNLLPRSMYDLLNRIK